MTEKTDWTLLQCRTITRWDRFKDWLFLCHSCCGSGCLGLDDEGEPYPCTCWSSCGLNWFGRLVWRLRGLWP